MKTVQLINIAILMFFLGIGCTSSISQRKIDADAFETIINKESNIQLVDVRTPQEFAEGYITNAINIDFNDPAFQSNIAKLDKNKPIAVYCAAGSRSGRAATMLKEMGFSTIYDLDGGITAWVEKGKKTIK